MYVRSFLYVYIYIHIKWVTISQNTVNKAKHAKNNRTGYPIKYRCERASNADSKNLVAVNVHHEIAIKVSIDPNVPRKLTTTAIPDNITMGNNAYPKTLNTT
jgi:hypothetical protein